MKERFRMLEDIAHKKRLLRKGRIYKLNIILGKALIRQGKAEYPHKNLKGGGNK
jgi:hypothetical protein